MAKFTYESKIYGPKIFTAPDGGGIVELNGKNITTFGGYLTSPPPSSAQLFTRTPLRLKRRPAHGGKNETHIYPPLGIKQTA